MATLGELVASGQIVPLPVELDDDQFCQRMIYMLPRVQKKIDDLEGRQSHWPDGDDLDEQLDDLAYSFLTGEDFRCPDQFHLMDHKEPGIWELKTPDLRVFGWFYRKDIFICTNILLADFVKHGACELSINMGLYGPVCNEVVTLRDRLDLDPPKFIDGEHHENILSNYSIR